MIQDRDTKLTEPVWIFPFQGMDIGDSFFIPTTMPARMIYVVNERAKAAGLRVKAFVSSKDNCIGVRVWRTG